MNKDIENIIRANLPEKKRDPKEYSTYLHMDIQGFNQALSQIDTYLIADEVLKVVVEKIRAMKLWSKGTVEGTRNDIINKLSYLSPNKENEISLNDIKDLDFTETCDYVNSNLKPLPNKENENNE